MKGYKPENFTDVLENNLCKFIKGDLKNNPVFCENEKIKGKPYCEEHAKVCFVEKKPTSKCVENPVYNLSIKKSSKNHKKEN